jgi:homeobox protein cut-like
VDPDPEEAGGGGAEARWGKAYEAKINPFVEFQASESHQRVQALQLHDRAVLASSKVLMGSRVARVFVASYAVVLHLFIMVLLYYSATPTVAAGAGYGAAGAAAQHVAGVAAALGPSGASL